MFNKNFKEMRSTPKSATRASSCKMSIKTFRTRKMLGSCHQSDKARKSHKLIQISKRCMGQMRMIWWGKKIGIIILGVQTMQIEGMSYLRIGQEK